MTTSATTDEQIMTFLNFDDKRKTEYVLDEHQTREIRDPDVVKVLVHDILARFGSTAIISRRKTAIDATAFIVESKNVMAHLPAFLRVAASLIRVSFKFSSFILKKYGSKSSLYFQVKNAGAPIVISYKDFVAFHEYVLKVRVLKIAKYSAFARKRLNPGVVASFNPVLASNALKAAMKNLRLPEGLKNSHASLLETCRKSIVSRGLVREIIRAAFGPGDTTGVTNYGKYIKYRTDDFFGTLVESEMPFSRDSVDLTNEEKAINKKAKDRVNKDNFFKNVLKSGKKEVALKPIFKKSSLRRIANEGETFSSLEKGVIKGRGKTRYFPTSSLISLISCHTLPHSDETRFEDEDFMGRFFPSDVDFKTLKREVDDYKAKTGQTSVEFLRSPEEAQMRLAKYNDNYSDIITRNKKASTKKARSSKKNTGNLLW